MRIIEENHKENDRIKREQAIIADKKKHTITCPKCNAEILFKDKNVHVACLSFQEKTIAYVICPCCHERIDVLDRGFFQDEFTSEEDKTVLKEGNFEIKMTCDNCESKFGFDYRDVTVKRIPKDWCETEIFYVTCPVCGKEQEVKNE